MLAGFVKALAFHHTGAIRCTRGRRMTHTAERTRRRARALAALDQLLVDAPDDADAKALRGHVLVHLYRPRVAIDAMRALVHDAPDHLMAWQTLAWASRGVNDTDAAQAAEARAQAIQRAARTATAGH
jgi:predicted Zn-dependent protease